MLSERKVVDLPFIKKTISFRNDHHKTFFLQVMSLFACCVFIALIAELCFFLGCRGALFPLLLFWFYFLLGLTHLIVSFLAMKETDFGKNVKPYFSIDCIWFNIVMFILYLVLSVRFLFFCF